MDFFAKMIESAICICQIHMQRGTKKMKKLHVKTEDKEQHQKKSKLAAQLKRKDINPDPNIPGKFNVSNADDKDTITFLSPNNWTHHDKIVENVLEGTYELIMPYSGEFVATLNCTNRCESPCPYKTAKEIEGVWESNDFSNTLVHMQSLAFATNLVDRLKEGGVKGLIFTGGGEPFLFPELEDLVDYTTSVGIDSIVYTNGNSVSETRAKKMVESAPKLIRTSLNAGTKEVYNKFSGIDSEKAFYIALATIETFARETKDSNSTDFGVSVVINKDNQYDLVESALRVREIADKVGGGIEFLAIRPAFDYWSSDQLTTNLLEETYEIVETQVRQVLQDTGVAVKNFRPRYEALMQDTRFYDECRASGLFIELGPSGKMYQCCERNCHSDYEIGDLTKSSLEEIWLGEEREVTSSKIKYQGCNQCPPACKPHIINNQFAEIERLRENGEMYKVELWINANRSMGKHQMVNF